MTHDLGGDVNDLAPQGGGVANRLEHRRAHVLLENLDDRRPLMAATHGAEKSLDLRKDLDVAKIADKQA